MYIIVKLNRINRKPKFDFLNWTDKSISTVTSLNSMLDPHIYPLCNNTRELIGNILAFDTLYLKVAYYIWFLFNGLRRLAPELFSSTAKDAIIYYSILIPLVQTYCTSLTELCPGTKKMCHFKFWKGFAGTIFWGGRLL
jgi:hypothetical protein